MSNERNQLWRGRIWTGHPGDQALIEDGVLESSDGLIRRVRPAEVSDPPADVDQHGHPYTFLPGMVDLHNHGGAGHSFPTSDAADCRTAARHHRSRGTTSMLASLVSADGPQLVAQADVLAQLAEEGALAGIHLEGPFLSPVHCGAQDPAALIPADPDLLRRIIKAGRGHVRSMTIAPEVEGFEEAVQVCAEHAVVVSLGHSDASADQTEAALGKAAAAGASLTGTHLFNGMPTLHHRRPGIAGALLRAASEGRITVELVADGVHLDDTTVAIALAAAPDRVAFVSDAMAAAGVGDGSYTLGGAAVTVRSGVARLTGPEGQPGSIAGGTSALVDQLLRHAGEALLAQGTVSAEALSGAARVVRACTSTPASVLGLEHRGRLEAGVQADAVKLDSAGEVTNVFVQGREQ